jgi:hypothetical protein
MTRHNQETEVQMVLHFSHMNEKNRRHYAAVEASKLGYGGQKYISELFLISPYRIRKGLKELNNPELLKEIPQGKQRRPGGGRKKKKLVPPKS